MNDYIREPSPFSGQIVVSELHYPSLEQVYDIPYKPSIGERGVGDQFLPVSYDADTPLVLLIHGGGWIAMDKESISGIAEFLRDHLGDAVFSAEYRLCGDSDAS